MGDVGCPTCGQPVPDADRRTALVLRLRHHTAYQGFTMREIEELADDVLTLLGSEGQA